MNLQEFISQALVQIAAGIRDAGKEVRPLGAVVNPRHVRAGSAPLANIVGYVDERKEQERAVHSVEFDIAVTAVEGKETKGGIGVVVGAFALDSQGRSEESNSSVSRIKFKVPIAFPNSDDEN
jgi:hypothetical protein